MLPELCLRSNLYHLLHHIELSLALETQQKRCPFCGGPLHHSDYMRKPRGGPDDLPEILLTRISFCCGNRSCRRRVLPPSVLFMGRRVYWANVILVVVTLRQNKPREYSKAVLMRRFGMDRKTINQWIVWFREIFPNTDQWKRIRGRVSSCVSDDYLPSSLTNYFYELKKSWEHAIIGWLKFLASGYKHAT